MSYKVAGDWGTSNLRLFKIENGAVVDRLAGPGIGDLRDQTPEQVLRDLLAAWRTEADPHAIHLCGMVGSRNGWVESAYVECPADARSWAAGSVRATIDQIPVTIGTGLACTHQSGEPDVMRGEETQIFGAMALIPKLSVGRHQIALPGTHSKWLSVHDGLVTQFRTFVTGELFALLRTQSTLMRASSDSGSDEDEATGFDVGLKRIANGGHLLTSLFETRAAQLRTGASGSWAKGFLSGIVIGSEIEEILPAVSGDITLIGDPTITGRYVKAFASRGLPVTVLTGEACSLAGLDLLETP